MLRVPRHAASSLRLRAGGPGAPRWSASLFGLPSLRIRGFYLAVATLAAQFFVDWAFIQVGWVTNYSASGVITAPADRHCSAIAFNTPISKYLLVLSIVAVMALAAKNMVRGNAGRAWMAVRDMDVAAEVIGIRPMRTKLLAFAVSSFYCGVAGALCAFALPRHRRAGGFNLDLSFQILFMIIIGGVGTILGSFLGAAFITLLPIFLNRRSDRDLGLPHQPTATISQPRADGVRRADHLLPDRRAARARAAVADRQGEAAAVAVSALRSALHVSPSAGVLIALRADNRVSTCSWIVRANLASEEYHEGTEAALLGIALVAVGPAPRRRRTSSSFRPCLSGRTVRAGGSGSPTATSTTGRWSTSATAASTASRSLARSARPSTTRDRGVECYERLKNKGPTGAAPFEPLSTGIAYGLFERAPTDKIPMSRSATAVPTPPTAACSLGCSRSSAPIGPGGQRWSHYLGEKEGGYDKLKGKKIAFLYHDSPYGKEPIPVFEELAKRYGFELEIIPVAAPGLEQKSTWLQIARQFKPDWTFIVGLGRDELDRDQGGGRDRLSARPLHRRVVGGRGTRCHAGR